MATLFVSDLHLAPERPAINDVFLRFVADVAGEAEALYLLGDLFERWVGDDDLTDPFNAAVANTLRTLADRGTAVHIMRGNRDLLVGQAFAERCGGQLIDDPTLLELYGTRTLVMHGDTLCTDDVEYQKFRTYVHDAGTQAQFLAQPLEERRRQMLAMREQSEASKQGKAAEIMDVAVAAVERTLREFGYPRLIHGHTHHPARHVHVVDGHACERWVLNDWYERGGYLHCDARGCTAIALG